MKKDNWIIISFMLLATVLTALACDSQRTLEPEEDPAITFRYKETREVAINGHPYEITVEDVDLQSIRGTFTENKDGTVSWYLDVFLLINMEKVTVPAVIHKNETGESRPWDWETMKHEHFIKAHEALEIVVSDVYQEPETEFIKQENYVVKLLVR